MTGCTKKTERFNDCADFTFKGVFYSAGECTYQSDVFPWCAIKQDKNQSAPSTEFQRNVLGKDWDFCNRECVLPPIEGAAERVLVLVKKQ